MIRIADILAWFSLIVGIVSIVLAIISMKSASNSEKNSQENFEKTQKMMNEIYDKTKDLLHQIDNKSSVISNSVVKCVVQLTNLFSNVLDRVIEDQNKVEIPDVTVDQNLEKIMEEKKINNDEISNQIALQLLPELMKHPENLEKLVAISEKINKKK